MIDTRMLSQSDVRLMIDAALAEAHKRGLKVTVAVTDAGGQLLGLTRMDGAAAISAQIAPAKANCSALGARPSADYEKMINGGRQAFISAPLTAMLEGGLPVMSGAHVIGGIGVSGAKSDEDVAIGQAGLNALPR